MNKVALTRDAGIQLNKNSIFVPLYKFNKPWMQIYKLEYSVVEH